DARGGIVSMITMHSWMFLGSFEKLRGKILHEAPPTTMTHLGERAFDSIGGSVVSTTAFVLQEGRDQKKNGLYLRLTDGKNEAEKSTAARSAIAGTEIHRVYQVESQSLLALPGAPLRYWLSAAMLKAFHAAKPMIEVAEPRVGLQTGNNGRFLRLWFEVSDSRFGHGLTRSEAAISSFKWFPYNKGGEYRKWYGNQDWVVNWEDNGREIRAFGTEDGGRARSRAQNTQFYFNASVSWSKVGIGIPSFRYFPRGFLFDVAGTSIFASEDRLLQIAAICNSNVVQAMLAATCPTLNVEVGTIAQLPIVDISTAVTDVVRELIEIHHDDWDGKETSWNFSNLHLIAAKKETVRDAVGAVLESGRLLADRVRHLEIEMNTEIARLYGLEGEVDPDVSLDRVTLDVNPEYRYGAGLTPSEIKGRFATDSVADLISYAVGCMFGRYSLD